MPYQLQASPIFQLVLVAHAAPFVAVYSDVSAEYSGPLFRPACVGRENAAHRIAERCMNPVFIVTFPSERFAFRRRFVRKQGSEYSFRKVYSNPCFSLFPDGHDPALKI